MLNGFDWLRRSQSGAELLATLKCLAREPGLFAVEEIGPPHSAFGGPCQRCWIYPSVPPSRRGSRASSSPDRTRYCKPCRTILTRASGLNNISRRSIVIWGYVNRLPKQLESGQGFRDSRMVGTYVYGQNHFLLMMHRLQLKACLQELVIYHGADLRGLIQILPPTGTRSAISMGDALCRAMHDEARFSMDRLRVRFFSAPHQLLKPQAREQLGLLTFEVSEFLSLLEMAAVFRTLLRPETQQTLHELLNLNDPSEEQFYWGRFLGYLSPEARDMLSAWRIRQWPKNRVRLLYELTNYVVFYQPD